MASAKLGDKVRVHYIGTLEDGSVFSSTYEEDEPFEFTIGEQNLLKSFDNAVTGMNVGEIKTISVHQKMVMVSTEKNLYLERKGSSFRPI